MIANTHPELAKQLTKWSLFVGGVDILKNLKPLRVEDQRTVFESRTKVKHAWVILRAEVLKRVPHLIKAWAWTIYGDTSISEGYLPRLDLRLTSTPGQLPQVDLQLEEPTMEEPMILQGQGRSVRQFYVDFKKLTFAALPGDIAEPNPFCPHHPNSTGGNWAYMGMHYFGAHLEQLFMLGAYGGYFLNDDGSFLTEAQRPQLQANVVVHRYSNDPGWMHYGEGAHMATFQDNQDTQHYCLFSPLAELFDASHNEGLRMLCEAAVHHTMRYIPSKPRGTSHSNSGGERGQGRPLKTMVDLAFVLREADPSLSKLIGTRAIERVLIDIEAFKARMESTGIGLAPFFRPDIYTANEVGIHYMGMWRLRQVLNMLGAEEVLPEVNWWLDFASKWLFDSFRFWDVPGYRVWGVPYYEHADHSTDNGGPVSSSHFAWLGATHYQPTTPSEVEKMKHILELGEVIPARFKE